MTCPAHSRLKRFSPSLLMAALVISLGACATAPPRPPAPISVGGERVEPGTGGVETSENGVLTGIEGEVEEGLLGEIDDGKFTPPHMVGRQIRRAAVLLPFSHPNPQVKEDAESLLAAVELALFNRGEDSFVILPKDTAGLQSTARARALEAIEEGAELIIGPLFSANIRTVREESLKAEVPLIGFSSRAEAAGGGAYLISVTPEEEVTRVVETAARRGAISYVYLGPDDAYGRRTEQALRRAAVRNGGQVIGAAFYDADNDAPVDEAQRIASVINAQGERPEGEIAVLIPEQGVKLRAVAPLLPYYGVDIRRIQMLGTGRWNDETVWREPTLDGGIFAAPDPANLIQFQENFTRIYGREPTGIAPIGYDAGAVAAALAAGNRLDFDGIADADGFHGVNGLFRFRADGTAERSLSILEIDRTTGIEAVEFGLETFDPPVG